MPSDTTNGPDPAAGDIRSHRAPARAGLSRRAALGMLGSATVGIATTISVRSHSAHATAAAERQRVVIVGGGVAGVALAWLLDGVHDVVLLEAAPELGGHARTIDVTVGGKHLAVDAGAQYFGPGSHKTYHRLLTEVLHVPIVPAPMDLTISRQGAPRPDLVSPTRSRFWPLLDPEYWGALTSMAFFTERGKSILAGNDRETTAEEFINSLPVSQSVRDNVLFPLSGSMFGFSVPQAKQMSAFSVLAFVIRGLGDGFLAPYDYYNATDGLRSVVTALLTGLSTVTTHVSAAAARLSRQDGTYRVQDQTGRTHDADHVVFALPPYAAGPLVNQLPGGAPIASVQQRFTYM
jgi:uncharacterized protein